MQVIMSRQVDLPIYIEDSKGNAVVDIENNHMELTMEDNSIFALPSVETYYSFIGEAELCFGDEEIYLDKVFKDAKVTLVNSEIREGIVVKAVCESKYNDESIWLLKI